jgi:hypothetical protein
MKRRQGKLSAALVDLEHFCRSFRDKLIKSVPRCGKRCLKSMLMLSACLLLIGIRNHNPSKFRKEHKESKFKRGFNAQSVSQNIPANTVRYIAIHSLVIC